jgi:hypothetical protein
MDGKDGSRKKDKKHKKKDKKDKEIEEAMDQGGEEQQQIEGTVTEVLEPEAKNILLHLLSQVRIGMDLSRVTLPTSILEPKSFLEKLTDFFTHPDVMLRYQSTILSLSIRVMI